MNVGVVDIGTNSMRLLITDGVIEVGRWVEVTGLGRGVDLTRQISDEAMERTLPVLSRFGELMDEGKVERRTAFATSAAREAVNRDVFFDRAEIALGVRPQVISGGREGILAFDGATAGLDAPDPIVVCDIGGGSTEFVSSDQSISVDIGSVRLTDRGFGTRPATEEMVNDARGRVRSFFSHHDLGQVATLVGVAGTWTSLAAIDQELPEYDRDLVHHYVLGRERLSGLVSYLSSLTIEETAAIPSLDPNRAPVILAGAVVAEAAVELAGVDEVIISERDTLDGAAMELLGLA